MESDISSRRPGRVLCVGSATVDLVLEVDELPHGETKLLARSSRWGGGGVATTAAVAVARLGGRATWFGAVGDDDAGQMLTGLLDQAGVRWPAAARVPESRTAHAAVLVDREGRRSLAWFTDRSVDLEAQVSACPDLEDVDAVVCDDWFPLLTRAVLSAARRRGIPAVLDLESTVGTPAGAVLRELATHVIVSSEGLGPEDGHCETEPSLALTTPRAGAVAQTVGVTLGPRGSIWRTGADVIRVSAPPVVARDTTGCGDVFIGAFTLALAEGAALVDAARFATAAAALKAERGQGWAGIANRHDTGCAAGEGMDMKVSPGKLWGMRRLADADGFWRIVATDQREILAGPIAATRGVDVAAYDDVADLVGTLVTELQSETSAVLVDPIYGYPKVAGRLDPTKGLMLTYESLYWADDPGGVQMSPIPGWSVEKTRRIGADAVKVLAFYRADASPATRQHQEDFVQRAGEECERHDIPMLLEILVYPFAGEDPADHAAAREQLVLEAVRPFRDPKFKVDIYKLEPPGPLTDVPGPGSADGERLLAAYHQLTDGLPRPWVLLSAGMGKDDFRTSLGYAYACGASGYLAGRALWSQAPPLFPDLAAVRRSLRQESRPYVAQLNDLTTAHATPWTQHPAYAEGLEPAVTPDRDFPQRYPASSSGT